MNFLAHCALAQDTARGWQAEPALTEGLLAGAVVGDFVKGPVVAAWPPELKAGVRLHRRIDALSNRNDGLRATAQRFPPELRRFAPIFVDMLADHYLSQAWLAHYDQDLPAFTEHCYRAIDTYSAYLSPEGLRFFDYMRDVDLLAHYDEWSNVRRGYRSVLRRLKRESWLLDCERASEAILMAGAADFAGYYPQLRGACATLTAEEMLGR